MYEDRHDGLLLYGGEIVTAGILGVVEALAIAGGRIVHAGSRDECATRLGSQVRQRNLQGLCLAPGFVDPHTHPLTLGQLAGWISCRPAEAGTIDAVVDLLRANAPESGAITAFGYHQDLLRERRHPTRVDLDRVTPDRPVVLLHTSLHSAVANSKTLTMLDITDATPDPPGGWLGRESDGSLDGRFVESALDLLTGPQGVKLGVHGPNFHLPATDRELAVALDRAQARLAAAGITTVCDAQVTAREMAVYGRAMESGALRLRFEMLVSSSYLDLLVALGVSGRIGGERLAINGVKVFADGSLTGCSACFTEPYVGRAEHGSLLHTPTELASLVERAHDAGLHVATHAQGDAAIDAVLDAIGAAQRRRPWPAARHRIEHCGCPRPDQIARIARLHVTPVTQPQHLSEYGDAIVDVLGDRGAAFTPLGAFAAARVPVVLSSDTPIVAPDPLAAIHAASTRRTRSGAVLGSTELRVSERQAFEGYTCNAAAVLRRSDIGSLEVGRRADFVVLDGRPDIPFENGQAPRVLETWIDGERVHPG